MKVHVVSLRDVDPDLRRAWVDLSADAVEPNPFFEPPFAIPAAQTLADGDAAGLLVVEDDGRLLFAMPVLRHGRFRRVPVPALTSWQHPYCYLGTPLVRAGHVREAWIEVLDFLRYRPEEDAWLVLDRMALHGPVAAGLHRALGERFASAVALEVHGRPVLRRRPEATYLDGRISARHLKTLRRQGRRLADALGGQVRTVDHAADRSDLPESVEAMLALEHAGWKGRAGTSFASRPGDADFFRAVCEQFAEQNRLQMWSLGVEDRAAAFQTNLLAGGAVFHFKVAYDEQVGACSPGLQLELAMVEEFHRDTRLDWIDSCVDRDNRVSAQLYPDREAIGTLLVPGRGARGVAAVRAAQLLTGARDAARSAGQRAADARTSLRSGGSS